MHREARGPAGRGRDDGRARRRGAWWLLLVAAGVAVGAWVGLRPGRRPVATGTDPSPVPPVPTPEPTPTKTPAEPGTPAEPETPEPTPEPVGPPADTPEGTAAVETATEPAPVSTPEPDAPTSGPPPAVDVDAALDLARVSGLGRRSAEALVVAGIATLEALSRADDDAITRALDAADVRRSATASSWPSQARRLLQG